MGKSLVTTISYLLILLFGCTVSVTGSNPGYHFQQPSPWYLGPYAFVAYILLFILLLFLGDYLSRRRRDRKTHWEIQKHTNKINEEKVDFLINISHELRTPLTLISGPLKRLIDKNSWNNPDELKEQLSSIYKQAIDMELLLTAISNQLKNHEAIRLKYKESYLHPVEVATPPTNRLDEEFMLKLNKLIHDNIASRQLDVKFLTTQMGISRTPLYTKLKALTNMGVNDYINMIRIEKASQLLIGSTKTITEISEMVGFEYPRHFSTLFKQIKGIPPSQYRAENGVK